MTVRVPWAAALALALAPMMTSCATGVSQDAGDLRRTTIGTYLARNAGTGTFQTSTFDKAIAEKAHSEILQRLLELARAGRDGPPNRLVNEAVAAQSGYVCPDYDLPPGPNGAAHGRTFPDIDGRLLPKYVRPRSGWALRAEVSPRVLWTAPTKPRSLSAMYGSRSRHRSTVIHPGRTGCSR